VEAWYVLPVALINSASPLLARLHVEDQKEFMREIARMARILATISWLLALGLALGAPWLMRTIYGTDYAAGTSTLAILAFSLPFAFLGLAVSPWYQNTGLTAVAMRRHLFGGSLNIGLNYLLIPRLGPAGAALGTMISYLFAHVLTNGFDNRTRPLLLLQLRALILLPPSTSCK
jgi:O-antigen/teichoic acid export membrane protein